MTAPSRSELFWWLYVVVLAGAALFIAHSFVGILVLGLFGYYATRPICHRFEAVTESEQLAAALTVLTVLVPILVLVLYATLRLVQQSRRLLDESVASMIAERLGLGARGSSELDPLSILGDPPSVEQLTALLSGSAIQQGLQAVDAVFGTVVLVALAITLSYALLVYDESLAETLATVGGGRETTVYAYALAVDTDMESVFFGNFLFVLVMSVVATATYAATNLVAPAGLQVPMVFTLGVLTGVTSLVPIVVGKIVYLPVVAYLAVRAAQQDTVSFVFVGGVLAVYFLVLDILPQSFVQPYISGRKLNSMLLLFAYVLGPILLGWYGFFLLPIVFVLLLETVRIVLPELLHGEPIAPEPAIAEETGADVDELSGETEPQSDSEGEAGDEIDST
ncbi:AI-2E family transporter [Halomicrobium sp. HM KBTZ05]|uniref:AI-2E family transporter n=1 Tax=Halomicrobium sp. HM KBTZ05 TaxID=3242663 RepID=UPI00355639F2